jgi:hypothetical protein
MPRPLDCFLFAGPTLFGMRGAARVLSDDIVLLPPARRGDIAALVSAHVPSSIVIADGLFERCLSVGHAEIRGAVERGWEVWGVSSLGAVRAYEMRACGVRGFGAVYGMFFRCADFQDDEVALRHGAEPPFKAFSEPLIHLRVALEHLVSVRLLDERVQQDVISRLKSLWYGARTLPLFNALLASGAGARARQIADELRDFDAYRIKQSDLRGLLSLSPWRAQAARRSHRRPARSK